YRQLPMNQRPVAVRSWLVLRFEPWEAPEAATVRGGGSAGCRAAIVAAAARLRARLAAAGVDTTHLGAEQVRDVVRQVAGGTPNLPPPDGSCADADEGRSAAATGSDTVLTASIGSPEDWERL